MCAQTATYPPTHTHSTQNADTHTHTKTKLMNKQETNKTKPTVQSPPQHLRVKNGHIQTQSENMSITSGLSPVWTQGLSKKCLKTFQSKWFCRWHQDIASTSHTSSVSFGLGCFRSLFQGALQNIGFKEIGASGCCLISSCNFYAYLELLEVWHLLLSLCMQYEDVNTIWTSIFTGTNACLHFLQDGLLSVFCPLSAGWIAVSKTTWTLL